MEESRVISGESLNGVSRKNGDIDINRPMPKSVRMQAIIDKQAQRIIELEHELRSKTVKKMNRRRLNIEELSNVEQGLGELQRSLEVYINKQKEDGDDANEELKTRDRQIAKINRQLKRKDEEIQKLTEELSNNKMFAANWRVRYNKKVTENGKIRESVTEIARHAQNALGVPNPVIKEEGNSSDSEDEGSTLEPGPSTRMRTRSSTRNRNDPPVLHEETPSVKKRRKK